MKNILLIGSEGYIGSYLHKVLKDYYHVSPIDLDLFGTRSGTDYNTIPKSIIQSYDTVILLAGHSSVGCSKDGPSTWGNNVTNFINLVSKLEPEQKFIYASSGSVVREGCYSPDNYYDLTKFTIDQYMSISNHKNYYGLRFGTVNGYSPVLRTDLMINAMVNSALTNNYLEVFGSGTKRPILGLMDLCSAVDLIIRAKDPFPGVYNLCSFNTTVEEVAQVVSELTKAEIRHSVSADMSPYSFEMVTAPEIIKTGWTPLCTIQTITKGLIKTIPYEPIKKVKRNFSPIYP